MTDIKPFQVIVIALLGVLAWQQYSAHNALQQPIKQNPETEIGRYQLLELSNMRRDRFMVDTKTGRAWVIVCNNTRGANKNNGSVAPEDCLSETFETITYFGTDFIFAPGPEQEEEAERIRAAKISLMSLGELKAFEQEEKAARIRAEKLALMSPEERKAFEQEEKNQHQDSGRE